MKKLVAFLVAFTLILTLVACSQPAPAPAPAPSSPAQSTASTASPPAKPSASQTTAPSATPQASGEKINLRIAIEWPEPSSLYQMLVKPILDDIEKNSNGRISFTKYLGAVLGKGPEQYDMVKTGKCDFSVHATNYTPGRFPMSDVMSLPGAWEANVASQDVALAAYDRILYKEYTDVHSISFHQAQLFYLYTTDKQVKTMDDLKGLKIRTSGGFVTDALKALGATPVPLVLTDVYTSLQTGVVNGVVIGPSAFPGYKLQEVLKNTTRFKFGTTTHVFIMTDNVWAKIPADLQKVINDACRKWGPLQIAMFEKDNPAITKALTDKGGVDYTLPAAEEAKWAEALKPMVADWVTGLKAKNLPADELMTIVREEAKKRNVPFPY